MSESRPILKIYQGFASKKFVSVFGHVFNSISPERERPTSNPFKNALEMYRRYRVKPATNQLVKLYHKSGFLEVKTDKRGYFRFMVDPGKSFSEFTCRIVLERFDIEEELTIIAWDPPEIIVSDIDDTILVSHATNIWKKLYLLLTKNHQTRKAFEGIRKFYANLEGKGVNKFFYVSSSEWNLYDFLQDFISFNKLPDGVLLLQDLKSGIIDLFKSGGGSHDHKKEKILALLETYPKSKFILIGDSGQKDPAIYRELSLKYPRRIKKIYIRDVRKSKREIVKKMIPELAAQNIELELFRNES